jgi:hypothetical protein
MRYLLVGNNRVVSQFGLERRGQLITYFLPAINTMLEAIVSHELIQKGGLVG